MLCREDSARAMTTPSAHNPADLKNGLPSLDRTIAPSSVRRQHQLGSPAEVGSSARGRWDVGVAMSGAFGRSQGARAWRACRFPLDAALPVLEADPADAPLVSELVAELVAERMSVALDLSH